jgi:hypothetical protein
MLMQSNAQRWFSTGQVAARLGASRDLVSYLVRARRIDPFAVVAGRFVYSPDQVALIAEAIEDHKARTADRVEED